MRVNREELRLPLLAQCLLILLSVNLLASLPRALGTEAPANSKCVAFAKAPEACIPFINHRVCVAPNITQPMMAATLAEDLELAEKLGSATCRRSWTAFVCGRTFPKCSYADEGKTVALVHPMCHGFCSALLDDCQGVFELAEIEDKLPNCDAKTATGEPAYPQESEPSHYVLPPPANTSIAYKCFVPGARDEGGESHARCPPHYEALSDELVDESKYITACQRGCPLATYSDPEYTALSVTQIVEGYFGCVLLLLVLIPFFVDYADQHHHQPDGFTTGRLPLCLYVASGLMGLGFIWPSFFDGFEHVTCEKRFIVADVTYFPCAVQGILLYWGTASLVMWWLNICLHLFVGSVAGIGHHSRKLRFFYYFLGWGLPTVGLVVAWASRQIGASPTSVNCFLDWDAADGWWANGLFYVELTVVVCVGFVALNLAVVRLLLAHGFAGFHKQGRLLVFAYTFLCIFLFMVIYWWVIEARRGSYEQATDHWFGCLAERFKAAEKAGHPEGKLHYDPRHDYGCVLARRNPFGMLYTQTLIVSAIPFAVALIFGHSWFTWNMWGTIVCSFLCVAIQSVAHPSSIFAGSGEASPSSSPGRTRRHKSKRGWSKAPSAGSLEMEDVQSKVKFVPLGSDDEEGDNDDWAGGDDGEAVTEADVGGRKGRKRSVADAEDSDEGDDTDDSGTEGDATDYTEDDDASEKDE